MLLKDFDFNINQNDAIAAILELVILMSIDIEMLKDAQLKRDSIEKSIPFSEVQDMYSNRFQKDKINSLLKVLFEKYAQIRDMGLDV